MRLTNLCVENFKRIVAIEITPAPGVTEISGANGAGKSSTLDAIAVWIDGLKVAPAEPIRKGAERARIRGRLGEMNVTRTIERKKGGGHTTRILFEAVEGKPYPATQKQLDDLIGEHHLDPLDFLALDSRGKFDALRAFVPGFDFAKAAQEQAADYERRTQVNGLARQARAAASLIHVPDGTPAEPIDEQALVRELQSAAASNLDVQQRRTNREKAAETIAGLRSAVAQAEEAIAESAREIEVARDRELTRLDDQIAVLQRQRAQRVEEYGTKITDEAAQRRKAAAEANTRAEELQARLDSADPLPEPIDTEALGVQIEKARATNVSVRAALERAKHTSTAQRYEAEAKALTEGMDARQAAKEQAIATAKLPVEGLEFGDGEILLHGVPFEQASTAQRLRAAVAYSVAKNGRLKLIWIRDASLLDDNSYAELQKLAIEFSVDIYLETVRAIGKDAIVLSDGELATDNREEAAA